VVGKCITHLKLRSVPQDHHLAIWAELQRRAETISAALAEAKSSHLATPNWDFRLSDTMAGLTVWMNSIDQQCRDGMILEEAKFRSNFLTVFKSL
jgi:hypothetical protein